MQIKVSNYINKSPKEVSQYFWDMSQWLIIWPAMEKIELLYEDGFHQEMLMHVVREHQSESNRTIRFLNDDGSISFFSPEPPPMMSFHKGAWLFISENQGCSIEAVREFSLIPEENESKNDFFARENNFTERFTQRLNQILYQFNEYMSKDYKND